MKITATLFFLVLATAHSHAQGQSLNIGQDALVWNVDQLTDTKTDTTEAYACQFVMYGKSRIVWIQKDDYTTEYKVSATKGKWMDASSPGKMEFLVTGPDRSGSLTFTKDDTGTAVEFKFLEKGANKMPFSMHVQSVTIKQP